MARTGLVNPSKTGSDFGSDADGINDTVSSSLSIERPFMPPLKSSAKKSQIFCVWF
jgi:hypothetical protein